jgi:hypothetical protein
MDFKGETLHLDRLSAAQIVDKLRQFDASLRLQTQSPLARGDCRRASRVMMMTTATRDSLGRWCEQRS